MKALIKTLKNNFLLNSINRKDYKTNFSLNIKFKNCSNWEPGQPDNWQDAPAGTEDCAEFYEGYPGTWNDQTCGYTRFYVCERDFNAGIYNHKQLSIAQRKN